MATATPSSDQLAALSKLLCVDASSSSGDEIDEATHPPTEARAMIRPAAAPDGDGASPAAAPSFRLDRGEESSSVTLCPLELDALAYVAPSAAAALCLVGREALLRQLRECGRVMASHGRALLVSAHHFLPPGRGHHVTVVYPRLKPDADANEAALAQHRRELHALLALPLDRPALRLASALVWEWPAPAAAGAPQQERLRDVHVGLPLPGPDASCAHLVQGSYDYHHYMQDRFDDSGWGCAYRCALLCVTYKLRAILHVCC